ncbi:unnamed protein product [Albugo candida]|uniref:Uncharacterized protein n=1 Tax=Albugo candida TaxID=65357 RepID=A0A024FZP0_9STRA|nr:unnamed protein product [Albugo candida]|eukprot:CCI39961.1 unnamed protein product [Albugo candida]
MCVLSIFFIIAGLLFDNNAVFVEPELLELSEVCTNVSIIISFIEKDTAVERTEKSKCGSLCRKNVLSDPITLMIREIKLSVDKMHDSVIEELRKNDIYASSFWITNQIHVRNATKNVIENLRTNSQIASIRQERKINNRNDATRESLLGRGHSYRSLKSEKNRFTSQFNSLYTQLGTSLFDGDTKWHIEKIKVSELWNLGYNGSKVRVGVIDSGAMATHPNLKDNFLKDYGWLDAISSKTTPYDDYGHGTAVLSVIAGSNGIGVAPGVEWMACRACDIDGCLEASLLRCAEFMLCPPDKNGSITNCSDRAPRIINNSWNDEKGQKYFATVLQKWIDAGIIPVFSMGNGGPSCGSVSSPSEYADAISVGAINRKNQLADYSARGPGENGALKPDLCAPGEDIIAADSTEGSASQLFVFQGTSAAAPQVSGAIAILLGMFPQLTLSQVRRVLQQSADSSLLKTPSVPCGSASNATMYPNNDYGYGQLNMFKALNVLKCKVLGMHFAASNASAPLRSITSSTPFGSKRIRFQLHPTVAVISCLCMAAAYVGVLYALPKNIRQLPRDHPTHIIGRLFLILILCTLCPFVLAAFSQQDRSLSFAEWLGIRSDGLLKALIIPVVITAVLFTGSLLSNGLRILNVSRQYPSNRLCNAVRNSSFVYAMTRERLPALRNYIVGPITEEFVFRSCMIPLLICSDFSHKQIILASPLTFGIAHLHHFIEHLRGGRSLWDAALIVGFQLLYTTLFGAYATFIYMRTGHLIGVFLVHMFCNIMGFPDVTFFNPDHSLHSFRISKFSWHNRIDMLILRIGL